MQHESKLIKWVQINVQERVNHMNSEKSTTGCDDRISVSRICMYQQHSDFTLSQKITIGIGTQSTKSQII